MLPDVDRLAASDFLHVFSDRLRSIGYDARHLASLTKLPGARLDDALRAPLRIWHLRKRVDEASIATRIFLEKDDVEHDEARRALGDLGPWLDAGLIEHKDDRITSAWRIVPFGTSWIIGDALESELDAVMAVGASTMLLAHASIPAGAPTTMLDSACDLGCGAGAVAIALSRVAKTVHALDVNPRAVRLAEINARLNGAKNVVAEVSDWFGSVGSKKFSLVASQPPFAAQLAGDERVVFLHGGARGDELPLHALVQIESHLEPAGLAFVQCDWPIDDATSERDICDRVRKAVGARGDLFFLRAPNQDLDEVVAHYAAARHAELGDAYRRFAIALRDHFERARIRAVCAGLVVLRSTPRDGLTVQIPARHAHDAPRARASIDSFVAATTLAHDDDDVLDRAALEIAPGIALGDAPDLGDGARGAIVRASAPAFVHSFALDDDEARALAEILRRTHTHDERTRRIARSLLLRGVLVPRLQNVPTIPR